jgi:hypothetical protein
MSRFLSETLAQPDEKRVVWLMTYKTVCQHNDKDVIPVRDEEFEN